MTHPTLRTPPLLIHALAAALLCPVVIAKPKSNPQKQPQPETVKKSPAAKPQPAKKTEAEKAAVVKAAVAAGKAASQKNNPAPVAVSPSQKAGDKSGRATGAPRDPQFALIADPVELLSRVPVSGPLGEEHLILLAIANSPLLEKCRAQIASARAEKRAVQDWENPELRLSYGSQDDNYVRRPYSERSIEQLNSIETATGSDSTTSLAGPGEAGFGESTVDTNASTTTTDRYRETVRTITPLKNGGEEVVTNVYELRREDETGTRDRATTEGDLTFRRSDALASNVTRTLTSTSRETTTSTQRSNASNSFSALIRFKIPNPLERRSRIQRASAEIQLAESKYLAEEDKLVRDVRERYETVSTLESTRAAHQKIRQIYTDFGKDMEGKNIPELLPDVVSAGFDRRKAGREVFEATSEIDTAKAELAYYCGLRDPGRIRGGSMTRRFVDPGSLDQAYLSDIAMLYRADAVEMKARLEIAKAHLGEAKASRIPWATFLDAGFSREWSNDRYGRQDEWTIRMGINIPLWDLFGINKKSAEFKKAVGAWEVSLDKQRHRVESDVALAIRHLRIASEHLGFYDKELREQRAEEKTMVPKLAEIAAKMSDYSKYKRTQYGFDVERQQTEIARLKAFTEYNKALMFLEDAIGVRIEKALNGARND